MARRERCDRDRLEKPLRAGTSYKRQSAPGAEEELMRQLFLAIVVAALPTCAAVAQQAGRQPNQPPKAGTLRAVKSNPCAKYGPGFIEVRGSNVCIKSGGSVEAGGGVSR